MSIAECFALIFPPLPTNSRCNSILFCLSSKLKNVDRSSGQAREITINNITIQITEYKVKDKRNYDPTEQSSTSEMSSHSESGFETSSTAATTSSNKSHSLL